MKWNLSIDKELNFEKNMHSVFTLPSEKHQPQLLHRDASEHLQNCYTLNSSEPNEAETIEQRLGGTCLK